jgi:hypothetical protein
MRCFSTSKQTSEQRASELGPSRIKYVLAHGLLACLLTSSVWACPLCKEAVAAVGGLAKGFYWSILLMLGVPVVLVTVLSGFLIKSYRPPRSIDKQDP